MIPINNDPELNGKYLGTISQDFIKVSDNIREASYQIRKRGFSDFPIFPISKEEIPIGNILFKKEDFHTDWNYYITYLDEFVQRKLISTQHLDIFKSTYKDPDEYCCLFVIDGDFTNFVYIPYPEE